jgi:hypothetical protein
MVEGAASLVSGRGRIEVTLDFPAAGEPPGTTQSASVQVGVDGDRVRVREW